MSKFMLCMHVDSDDMLVQAVFQAWLKEHKTDQMAYWAQNSADALLQIYFNAWSHGFLNVRL